MNGTISWFEIPVQDLDRAKEFYERIFDIELKLVMLANDLQMAMFPRVEKGVSGALCLHKDFYFPGTQGPLIYLNAEPDLEPILKKAVAEGGKMLVPKTQISEDKGYMAVMLDSEGNRIALYSMQ